MMFVLGILLLFAGIMFSVAWHELGHYLAARKFGIKVPEFFVGFGKTVWSRKSGETEFGIKMIPLGGYVRMIGMLPPAKGETLGRSRGSSTTPGSSRRWTSCPRTRTGSSTPARPGRGSS